MPSSSSVQVPRASSPEPMEVNSSPAASSQPQVDTSHIATSPATRSRPVTPVVPRLSIRRSTLFDPVTVPVASPTVPLFAKIRGGGHGAEATHLASAEAHQIQVAAAPVLAQARGRKNTRRVIKITNCRILRDHKLVENDSLWIENGKIIDPQPYFFEAYGEAATEIDAGGLIISPGFVELQLNGAFGVDFTNDRETLEEGIPKVARGLLKFGCTSFLPTIVSSKHDVYRTAVPKLYPRRGNVINGAEVLGAHLEGPFMALSKKGAHEVDAIIAATQKPADFEAIYHLSEYGGSQIVKLVTVAPELPGVVENIPKLVAAGICVSIGHTSATTSESQRAVEAGARKITHLFNAMHPFHHRDPGPIGLLGASDIERPYYGIICDGVHCHPNSVKIAYNAHPRGACLVTDAMGAAGLPPGKYKLGNMTVDKVDGAAYIEGTDTLAGSVVTLDECVRNFRKFTGCSIIEALESATLHPATCIGVQDRKGTLNYGADADILFLDDDLNVKRVFIAGVEVDLDEA